MNIMLLSVTERTREIGIRRAVGARAGDVLLQFLAEAIALSVIGGLAGIVLGAVASGVIAQMLRWSTSISPASVVLSFAVAAIVGVFFGYYPARQASRLDPDRVAAATSDAPAHLRIALRALGRHKLRTALTTLGMTIGVAAVITMVALGTGAQETVADDVRSAGTNLIRVDAGNYTRGGEESKIATGLGSASTLTRGRCGRDCGDGRREVRVERRQAARLRGQRCDARVSAGARHRGVVSAAVRLARRPREILSGRRCRRRRRRSPCSAPARATSCSAPDVNPVGHDLVIRDATVRVVGVVSGGDDDQMDAVYVPYHAAAARRRHREHPQRARCGGAGRRRDAAGRRHQAAAAQAPPSRQRCGD